MTQSTLAGTVCHCNIQSDQLFRVASFHLTVKYFLWQYACSLSDIYYTIIYDNDDDSNIHNNDNNQEYL